MGMNHGNTSGVEPIILTCATTRRGQSSNGHDSTWQVRGHCDITSLLLSPKVGKQYQDSNCLLAHIIYTCRAPLKWHYCSIQGNNRCTSDYITKCRYANTGMYIHS